MPPGLLNAAPSATTGPIRAGCGTSDQAANGANRPPVDDSVAGNQPVRTVPEQKKGMSTTTKVALLAGAAALYYLYNKNKQKYRMYRREHAEMLFQIGISLFRMNRRASGWRTLGKSVSLYPKGILFSTDYIQTYLVNKLNRLVRYA